MPKWRTLTQSGLTASIRLTFLVASFFYRRQKDRLDRKGIIGHRGKDKRRENKGLTKNRLARINIGTHRKRQKDED